MKKEPNPWLVGAAGGGVIVIVIFSSAWFPSIFDPSNKWIVMTICFAVLAIGILVSTYWRFLGSLRFWFPILALAAIDGICVWVFPQIRKLDLWDIDLVPASELFAALLFLNWFLDVKKTRRRE